MPSLPLTHHLRQDSSIGALLIASGKITQQQAENVIRLQEALGLQFGEAAIQLNYVSQSDVQEILAQQFNYPYLQKKEKRYSPDLIAAYQPFSQQVETLRAIRSQLMLRWFSRGRHALVILGIDPDGGTSLFAANLSLVFSQLGKKTLLVDANLRNPTQHKLFSLQDTQGLSDILAGRADIDVISKIEPFMDLSVLSSGTIPPNPQEILGRDSFNSLNNQLIENYDIILYDVTPYSIATDALAILAQVDGVLLIARKQETRFNEMDTLIKSITSCGVTIVGSVLVDF